MEKMIDFFYPEYLIYVQLHFFNTGSISSILLDSNVNSSSHAMLPAYK